MREYLPSIVCVMVIEYPTVLAHLEGCNNLEFDGMPRSQFGDDSI